jgi:DNA-binding MarR family transcriptional regulator
LTYAIPPPLLGALLRRPVDVIHKRIIDGLHERGFTDLVPAHLAVLRYPGPHGQRPVETLGYLERRDDPEDLRSKRVYLTERGEATRQVIRAAVREVEEEWARELGAEDLEQLRALLVRLGAVVPRSGSHP